MRRHCLWGWGRCQRVIWGLRAEEVWDSQGMGTLQRNSLKQGVEGKGVLAHKAVRMALRIQTGNVAGAWHAGDTPVPGQGS